MVLPVRILIVLLTTVLSAGIIAAAAALPRSLTPERTLPVLYPAILHPGSGGETPVDAQFTWLLAQLHARADALTVPDLTARFAPKFFHSSSPE